MINTGVVPAGDEAGVRMVVESEYVFGGGDVSVACCLLIDAALPVSE